MRPTTDQSKAQCPQDMCELGHSQEAGVWVPKTHTHAAHPPAARTPPPHAHRPREARADIASLGSLGPLPLAEADPVGNAGGGGMCEAGTARPEGKGFASQSASQDFQRVAREGEGSRRGGRRARVRQHASYGWSYCCYCCPHHPRGDPRCKGLVRRQRATAKRGYTRRLTLPDAPS